MPYFILEGKGLHEPIGSMPGIFRSSIDTAIKEIESDHKKGIEKILLFGIPDKKDETGNRGIRPQWRSQKALREIKKAFSSAACYNRRLPVPSIQATALRRG